MIPVSRLFCSHCAQRTAPGGDGGFAGVALQDFRKPAVVWTATRTCNLRCSSCYANARQRKFEGELSTAEARAMIDDLARFGAPVLVVSGGEPLLRKDAVDLMAYARERGLRPVLWSNGTLATPAIAAELKNAGVSCVGISLDGLGMYDDHFRGKSGAFGAALAGIRNCVEAGHYLELRVILTRRTYPDLEAICDFAEQENVNSVCFHHAVYSGRGNGFPGHSLSHDETRQAVDLLQRRAEDFHRRGVNCEISTAENDVDGVFLYLRLARRDGERAAMVYSQLAKQSGSDGAGLGVANIDARGDVHPDRFWPHYSLGNIRQKSFSEIWADGSDPLLAGLRNPFPLLKGRCAKCLWKTLCGGGMRVRADQVFEDPWMPDPACYLKNEELTHELPQHLEAMEDDVLTDNMAA